MLAHPLLEPDTQAEYRSRGWWRDVALASVVHGHASTYGAAPAVLGDTVLSYQELDDSARRLATAFSQRGVGAGDAVVVVHRTAWETMVVQVACSWLGASLVPLSQRTPAARACALVSEFRAPALVVESTALMTAPWQQQLGDPAGSLARLSVLCSTGSDGRAVRGAVALESTIAEARPMDPAGGAMTRPGDPAVILMTGGTTGPAKAAMQSDNAMMYSGNGIIEHFGLTGQDVYLGCGQYGHVGTVGLMMYVSMMLGIPVVPFPTWDPQKAVETIARWGVTYSQVAPAALFDIFNLPPGNEDKLKTLRCVASGGQPNHFFDAFEARYGTIPVRAYGMTEYFCHTIADPDRREMFKGLDGLPHEGTEIVLVDPGTDQPVAAGSPGEALIRGPGLFLGYCKRPDLTRQAVTGEGFYRSGDLLVHENGERRCGYRVVGRIKDVIRRGSLNIDPVDIENLLGGHPSVSEVVAVGYPDLRLGERVAVAVVLHPGAPLTFPEVTAHLLREGLAKDFLPERLELFAELPRTEVHKHDKLRIRALVVERISRAE